MHDVLISYSTKDKLWGDGACAALEARGIRCWIAPRDIMPGTEWGAAIIDGIDACKVMVLIFSASANESPQVRREVERAISKGLTVVPCRVENVTPVGAMEFALGNTHWLDVFTPPVERQMKRLAESVQALLPRDRASSVAGGPPLASDSSGRSESLHGRSSSIWSWRGKRGLAAAAAFTLFLLLAASLTLAFWPRKDAPPGSAALVPETVPPGQTASLAKSPAAATSASPALPNAPSKAPSTNDERVVQLTLQPDALAVTVGGKPFTVYNFAKSQRKPYFCPIRGPGGQIVTRSLENPLDHPFHKGLWFSLDAVNGIGFWVEKGKIVNVSVEPIVTHGDPARFKVVNHWLGKDSEPVVIESTFISINANRVIAYDAELIAGNNPVSFKDTKEGMFALRVADSMSGDRGGMIENAEGLHGESQCWGKTADWVDYDGHVDGKLVGVAIFDNPHNFRRSRYHVRDYGLFAISPFGEHGYTNGRNRPAPVTLVPGESLLLRYAIYVHDGDTRAADVAGAYRQYVATSK
jgi:hypothetical protein